MVVLNPVYAISINNNLVLKSDSLKRAPIKEIVLLKFETWIVGFRLNSC